MSQEAPERLTRAERREQTRALLLEAAARVFAARGLDGATVDDVAAAAGFTKGAVYSHFGSKDELFLAMLEGRYSENMAELERLLDEPGDPGQHARAAGREFEAEARADPDWQRVYLEAMLRAMRDDGFRSAFAKRHREMHDRLSATLARRLQREGVTPVVPPERLAVVISALANGILLETLVSGEGDAATDDLFGSALALLAAGVGGPASSF